MPKDFDACRRNGGRVRTITGPSKRFGLVKGQYVHVCFLNGGMYQGETRTKKEESEQK